MNPEIPKPEKIEDGTDLYDGMIFGSLDNIFHLSELDEFSLKKVNERLKEYYEIMSGKDYIKGEQLTERLGFFINHYTLRQMLDYSSALLLEMKIDTDEYDVSIISSISNPFYLDRMETEDLLEVKNRLNEYYSVLSSDDEKEKEKLSEKLGESLTNDSVKGLLDYVAILLQDRERKGDMV